MRKLFLAAAALLLVGTVSGTNHTVNSTSNSTGNDTVVNEWNFTSNEVNSVLSVGTTDSLDLGLTASGNESESVELNVSGNISDFVYSIQSPVSTIPGQEVRILNQIVIDRTQMFGDYNGTITGVGGNETEKVNISITVVDDIPPEITGVGIGDTMALTDNIFNVDVKDNLNVSSVEGSIKVVDTVERNNSTVKVNKSFKEGIEFERDSGESWSYSLNDTDRISQYYIDIVATDSSNNTANITRGFKVNGLESIDVEKESFVFSTIRPKEKTSEYLISSGIEGKEFTVSLEDLSYGGNATVQIGVQGEESESPTFLEKGETRTFDESGNYRIVLQHQGSNEIKGVHSLTGSLKISKPGQHVQPRNVNVSFSGSVKNVDKPPETCTRIKEFNSCLGYSFRSAENLFQENFGELNSPNQSHVFMISRIPTSEVEGSEEWSSSTSIAMGEYNRSETENAELRSEVKRKVEPYWKILFFMLFVGSGAGIGFLYFIYPTFEWDRKRFREKKIRKIKADSEKKFGWFG